MQAVVQLRAPNHPESVWISRHQAHWPTRFAWACARVCRCRCCAQFGKWFKPVGWLMERDRYEAVTTIQWSWLIGANGIWSPRRGRLPCSSIQCQSWPVSRVCSAPDWWRKFVDERRCAHAEWMASTILSSRERCAPASPAMHRPSPDHCPCSLWPIGGANPGEPRLHGGSASGLHAASPCVPPLPTGTPTS